MANGYIRTMSGTVRFKTKIDDLINAFTMVILDDTCWDLLLGHDFFINNEAFLDNVTCTIHLEPHKKTSTCWKRRYTTANKIRDLSHLDIQSDLMTYAKYMSVLRKNF